ncbi:MAG TPA: invasion associated locus B family protein [Rhizomicrobium sp.]
MTSIFKNLAGALALSLLAGGALAAPAPADGPVNPSETKVFGDWTVRCFPVASQSPCDMFELLANKTSGQRVMSLSIAYMPSGDKHIIQIAVPLGVAIQKGLVLSTEGYTSPTLRYRRCDRGGCYVEMLLEEQVVGALASGAAQAGIRVVADGGKSFDIPFSLKGFADAHGAMQDLARKKTAAKPDAATPAPDATTPAPTAPEAPPPAP